jgi:hypothetical protein
MKNKKNYLMWALCSCAGALMSLSACSDSENLVDEGTVGSESAVYAKVIITVPTSSTTTRALTRADAASELEGTASEKATENEYSVNNLYIYAFTPDATGGDATFAEMATVNSLSKKTDASDVEYQSDAIFKTLGRPTGSNTQDYKLLAIANVTQAPAAIAGTTKMSAFLADTKLDDGTWLLPTDAKAGKFVMASRAFSAATNDGAPSPAVIMTVTASNSETNPATAAITVERLHAKYSLTVDMDATDGATDATKLAAELKTTVGGTAYAKLTIDGYYPFNISKNSYVFRHRQTRTYDESGENPALGDVSYCDVSIPTSWLKDVTKPVWKVADYVVDPDWSSKTGVSTKDISAIKARTIYNNQIHNVTNSDYIGISKSEIGAIGYSYENTMLAEDQYVENSTGILFRAQLEPQNVVSKKVTSVDNEETSKTTTNPTYFYYNETFFDSWEAVVENYPGLSSLVGSDETATDKSKDLAEKGISIFAPDSDGKYYCYYTYIVKHYTAVDTSDAENSSFMAPMKFVTVRNNWYTIAVKGISRIGSPNPDPYVDETTPTPDESTVIYLQVTLSVKEWVPRDNTGIVLQ